MEDDTAHDCASQATSRRTLLASFGALGGALAGGALLGACGTPAATQRAGQSGVSGRPSHPHLVRVIAAASIYATGVLGYLAGGFERASGYRVDLATSGDVLHSAMQGRADLVICDYVYGAITKGHPRGHGRGAHQGSGNGTGPGTGRGIPGSGTGHGVPAGSTAGSTGSGTGKGGGMQPGITTESFVMGGHGLWPAPFLSISAMIAGPPSDPAGIRGEPSAVAAIQRIAATASAYVVPGDPLAAYLDQLLFTLGNVTEGSWWEPTTMTGQDALALAADRSAYTIWNGGPIPASLAKAVLPMVTTDPLLRRDFVSVVVNPARVPAVNALGAEALQNYLVEPDIQAAAYTYGISGGMGIQMLPDGSDDIAV